MIRRLRVKFICINMAIVTVMMLAILGMLLHFTRDDLEQQSIRVMQSVMEDRAYPSRPGEFPRQAQLPYFYVSVNTLGELSASFGGYYDLTDTEAIQQIITLALNSGEDTGILKDYSLRFQKRTTPFGQTIVFVDMSSELATMRSLTDTCILIGVLGFAVFLGLSFLLEKPCLPQTPAVWGAALFLGVFCSGVGFVIQTVQQQYTSASHVGLIFTLEPVFSAIVAYFFAHEVLQLRGYIGAALMMVSLLVMELDWKSLLRRRE